jgi:flagellin
MPIVINTNLASLNAQRNLGKVESGLNQSIQRLSSGLRINSAKDDAAGLYVAEQFTADIRGLNQAVRNAQDGISLGQTAEGSLAQVANNLQRIREIAVQAANATVGDSTGLQNEVDQLTQEISRIVQSTEYNGTALLSAAGSLVFQVGQDGNTNQQVTLAVSDLTSTALSAAYSADLTATGTVDVSTTGAASATLADIDAAINQVSTSRATFGAIQNRFEAVISNLQNYVENLSASRSRIQDADFATETASLIKAQILQQAGVAVLAQANTIPQTALALLR